MYQGTLYIVSAPSGAGKSSLISRLLETTPNYAVKVSVSHTTREKRPNEKNGIHYHYVSEQEFETLITQNDFLEYAKVFGNYYGTSHKWITEQLSKGIDVFLDIDWQGARQIKEKVPDVKTIFITPPSKEELERRLIARAQDSDETIQKRMLEASSEISHIFEYDYVIINDDFDIALMDLKAIIRAEKLKKNKQVQKNENLINSLIKK